MFRKLSVAALVTACAWLGIIPATHATPSTKNVHLVNSWRARPADIMLERIGVTALDIAYLRIKFLC